MAENRVSIDGVIPVAGTMPMSMPGNSASNPIFTTGGAVTVSPPYYSYSVIEGVGTMASNNFLSLFNPLASGKTLSVVRFIVSPWASGATTTTRSMTVQGTSAASGGTAVAAANIPKFASAQANSVADIRTGNPTVTTVGIPVHGFPPAVSTAGAGVTTNSVILAPIGTARTLAPGEGLVWNVAAGTTGQLWNLNVTWYEQ